jgi:hypothetical protein
MAVARAAQLEALRPADRPLEESVVGKMKNRARPALERVKESFA